MLAVTFEVLAYDPVSILIVGTMPGTYRDALSRYGQVLECDHGNPVGDLTRTNTGLTCRDNFNDDDDRDDRANASDHDLRVGSPHNFRLVGVDDSKESTKFVLMLVEIAQHQRD